MNVGIMLMSDRGPDGKPWDWRAALARWKTCGLEAVDVFDRMLEATGTTVKDMGKILADLGLKTSVYCVPTDLVSPDPQVRNASLDKIRQGIEACHELGVTHLFSHGGQHTNEGNEALMRYVDGLGKAADLAADADLTFSIENAGKLCNTDSELRRCIDLVNRDNMGVTYDGGNFILAGSEPIHAATLLAPDVVHVHVKSFVPAPENTPRPFKYCPIDRGLTDYRAVRDIVTEAGFDGTMSFEPEGGFDSQWEYSLGILTELVNEYRRS